MKKTISFIYGAIAYVVFLVAFLYAIGFVGDFLVPKAINSGESTSVLSAVLINLAVLSLFAIQHSIMARPAFKKWFTKIIHPAIERSTFVLLSSLILLLIYWQWQPMTDVVWQTNSAIGTKIVMGIYFFGWLVVFLSTFMINHFELFGLKQIFENFKNKLPHPPAFQKKYFYTIVRHPIMLGFIIAFWAAPVMTWGRLLFAAVTTVYILIAVKYLEEKDLRKAIGPDYDEYQKSVPMIVPFTKAKK
jgi:protein-S-isoprenylcysteine O-methyltransferase Ste14